MCASSTSRRTGRRRSGSQCSCRMPPISRRARRSRRRRVRSRERFWPGPLTIVLVAPRRGTLAFRVPDHPLARRLISAFGGGLPVTSANRSGQPDAAHRAGGHRPARRAHRARSRRRPDNRRAVLDDRRLHHAGCEGPSRRRDHDRGDPERDRIGEGRLKIGIAADHAGQALKATLIRAPAREGARGQAVRTAAGSRGRLPAHRSRARRGHRQRRGRAGDLHLRLGHRSGRRREQDRRDPRDRRRQRVVRTRCGGARRREPAHHG